MADKGQSWVSLVGKDKIITDCISEEGAGIPARKHSKSGLDSESGAAG